MSNPLFNLMRPQQPNVWQLFQGFAKTVNGNPRTIVEGLLSSGRMTQEQFAQFGQMANSIMGKKK